jgi:SOS regulatory protein LexA
MKQYVDDYYFKHRRFPSTSEIAGEMGIVKSTAYKYLVAMDERGILKYDGKEILTDKIQKVNTDTTHVAVLGSISCGIPQLEEEYIEEYVTLPVSMFGKGEFFILRANGKSMIEAGINDGDLVVIKKKKEAKNGQIVVALIENENTLKRFYLDKEKKCIRLHPENRTMEDIIVSNCEIQGVAVHVIKALE